MSATAVPAALEAPRTLEERLAFFERHHYLCIPGALGAAEVEAVNRAIDRDRAERPSLWGKAPRFQSAQCLLTMPECDFLIRHRSFIEDAERILDGDIVFDEFSIMVREGNQAPGSVEGWHRDFMPDAGHRWGVHGLSAIYYLTDVDRTTARYALVPASHRRDEQPAKLREDGEDREGEVEVLGPAGTVVLVNAGNWHCGKWGHSPRERRTAHIYYRKSTTRFFGNHTVCPRRLWDVDDAEQRRFYSSFNALTATVAQDYAR